MSVSIKTKFFRGAGINEDGKKDIEKFACVPEEDLFKILEWYLNKTSYPRYDRDDFIELAEITGQSGEVIIESVGVIKLILDMSSRDDDNPEDFLHDLISLELVEKEHHEKLARVFKKLRIVSDKLRVLLRKSKTEGFAVPSLVSSSMTAAIKPVYERDFKYGRDKIEEYDPMPIGYAVLGEIQLKKSDSDETFCVQLNRDNFNRFISDLLVVQTEMESMQKLVDDLPTNKAEKEKCL